MADKNVWVEVDEKDKTYRYKKDVQQQFEGLLAVLKFTGHWTLIFNRQVRARGNARIRVPTMHGRTLEVILKPRGQDSAALFQVKPPPGIGHVTVWTALHSYLQPTGDETYADSEAVEEVDEAVIVAQPIQADSAVEAAETLEIASEAQKVHNDQKAVNSPLIASGAILEGAA
jgi:hypothetical protein